jgi:hypothetical protein
VLTTAPDPRKVETERVKFAFEESVSLTATRESAVGSDRFVALVEPVVLAPGMYKLISVMSGMEEETPHADLVMGQIPGKIRSKPAITMHSILGRPARADTVVFLGRGSRDAAEILAGGENLLNLLLPGAAGGSSKLLAELGFEPLVEQRLSAGEPATVLTSICRISSKKERRRRGDTAPIVRVKRQLLTSGEQNFPEHVGSYEFDSHRQVSCVNVNDRIPGGSLRPGQRYVYQAVVVDEEGKEIAHVPRVSLEFEVIEAASLSVSTMR